MGIRNLENYSYLAYGSLKEAGKNALWHIVNFLIIFIYFI